MSAAPVIAIFDIGKTNKKLLLFDKDYKVVYEKSINLPETTDEDGDPCENLDLLQSFVFNSLNEVKDNNNWKIKAINFSTYGASFVFVDEKGKPVAPLYNYLKPYPEYLKEQFYKTYSGEKVFSLKTASPVLGSLNSGMQLYRIKYEKPDLYDKIKYALHLPQYLSSLLTGQFYSDITSIGCHTNLCDFSTFSYHEWVKREGIAKKLTNIFKSDQIFTSNFPFPNIKIGIGLHDSSAALIPYLKSFHDPFVLISTGTWCISLNPFNEKPLNINELEQDCLCYLSFNGKPIKASRLFSGNEHEHQVKRTAEFFNVDLEFYKNIYFNHSTYNELKHKQTLGFINHKSTKILKESLFSHHDLSKFKNFEEAYHQLILDLVIQQCASTRLVLEDTDVKQIFVDGGFSKNQIYMQTLALEFPEKMVYAASMAQATALGTAMAIHDAWNDKPLPDGLVELKPYLYPTLNHTSL